MTGWAVLLGLFVALPILTLALAVRASTRATARLAKLADMRGPAAVADLAAIDPGPLPGDTDHPGPSRPEVN